MKILFTGTEDYIGARMGPWLAAAGHDLRGLDVALYRDDFLYTDPLGMPVVLSTVYEGSRLSSISANPKSRRATCGGTHLAELSLHALGGGRACDRLRPGYRVGVLDQRRPLLPAQRDFEVIEEGDELVERLPQPRLTERKLAVFQRSGF
jgi:hypothetical protein